MAEKVTLELSEVVTQRARETAQRTGRSFEAVLAEWLERGAEGERLAHGAEYPIFTPFGNEAAAQTLLEVLNAARTTGAETSEGR
jgi:hypothetical protein